MRDTSKKWVIEEIICYIADVVTAGSV